MWFGQADDNQPLIGSTVYDLLGEVGVGYRSTVQGDIAIKWDGWATAGQLSGSQYPPPAPLDDSIAYGVTEGSLVGIGQRTGGTSAVVWYSTGNAVELRFKAKAWDVAGDQQAGEYFISTSGYDHAALWSGTPESLVDLNPSNFQYTRAFGTDGNQQVGEGLALGGEFYLAMLWTGTAESYIELYDGISTANAVSNGRQVGQADTHAALWTGSPDRMIDLHDLVPAMFTTSEALDVDADGNIVGWVKAPGGETQAAMWVRHQGAPDLQGEKLTITG